MDKNSLILEIKNDLNSIKKQVEVTLAKIDVLEALIKLEVTSGARKDDFGAGQLGVKEEPKFVPAVELASEVVVEPIVESATIQEIDPEPVVEAETSPIIESDSSTPHREVELRNLMSVIGLNDRFRFRHDLFSNSDELFKETIDILNKIEDFDKAVDYLVQKFAWDEEDATVVYFYDIIKPKF